MKAISDSIYICFTKYFTFKGRAKRQEFWWFFLFTILIGQITSIASSLQILTNQGSKELIEAIDLMFNFAIFGIPSIAVGCRRLHDIGKSGWWQLLTFTVIGLIPLFIWFATDSDKNENSYDESVEVS